MTLLQSLSAQAKETFRCESFGARIFLKDGSHIGCVDSDVVLDRKLQERIMESSKELYCNEVKKTLLIDKNITRRSGTDIHIPYLGMIKEYYNLWDIVVLYEKRKKGVASYYFCNLKNIESFNFEDAFKFGKIAVDLLEDNLLKNGKKSFLDFSIDENEDVKIPLFIEDKEINLTWKQYRSFVAHKVFHMPIKEISWYLGVSDATIQVYIKRVQEKIEHVFHLSVNSFFSMNLIQNPKNTLNFRCFCDHFDFSPTAPKLFP